MTEPLAPKLTSEIITVEVDFTDVMLFGEVVESATVTVEVLSGLDYSPQGMLLEAPDVTGRVVQQQMQEGNPGVVYGVVVSANCSLGNTYIKVRQLAVLSDDGSFQPGRSIKLVGQLPDGTKNVPYSHNLAIIGGFPPYRYDKIVSGAAPFWMNFHVEEDQLVCAGTPNESVTTNYAFSPQIADAANNLADDPQNITVATMTLSGDVPDGTTGDAVSGSYTQTGGVEPVVYTVDSGTWPLVGALAADGTYNSTYSTGGSYSWVVKAVDAVGTIAYLSDSCEVVQGVWWLTHTSIPHRDKVWQSQDLTTWSGPIQRVPYRGVPSYGAFDLGSGIGSILGGTSEYIPDTAIVAGTILTDAMTGTGDTIFRGGNVCIITSSSGSTYYTSVNKGVTWVARSGAIRCVNRMNSGRWIAYLSDGANSRMVYSDETVPTTWHSAAGGGNRGSSGIACNGAVACVLSIYPPVGNGVMLRTVDGATWTHAQLTPNPIANGYNTAIAINNTFMIGADQSGNKLYRSTDAGVTWSSSSFFQIRRVDRIGNTLCATSSVSASYTTDEGASWTSVPLPITPGTSSISIGPVTTSTP